MKEKTTKEEREKLAEAVNKLILKKQGYMTGDIVALEEAHGPIKRVIYSDYNVRNLFKELGILDLRSVYANAISDRENYHTKNQNYYKLCKAFGI